MQADPFRRLLIKFISFPQTSLSGLFLGFSVYVSTLGRFKFSARGVKKKEVSVQEEVFEMSLFTRGDALNNL